MRYLKRFNESVYYENADLADFAKGPTINISDSEISKLKNIKKNDYLRCSITNFKPVVKIVYSTKNIDVLNILVVKTIDEYYMIRDNSTIKYYKCDQFDGLKKFIMDRIKEIESNDLISITN